MVFCNVLNKKIERVYKKYASLDLDVQDKDQIENIIKSMPIKSVDKFNKLVDQMQCDIEKVCNSTGKSIQKNSKTSKILENKNIIRNLIR